MSKVRRYPVLTILSIAGLLAIFSSTASKSPTLPLFAQYLGASPSEIGIIAASSTIVGIAVNVVAGTLSDIYGRRALLITSGIFFFTAPFLYLIINTPKHLILVRVYHGVATAIFTPVATAAIADVYKDRRGEVMGYFSSATLVGRLLAPTVAGITISLYSFTGTYFICGLFGFLAFLVLLKFPETKMKTMYSDKVKDIGILKVLTNLDVVMASIIMAITYLAIQSIETFLPIYMSKLGLSTWVIGVVLTIELVVMALLKPYGGYLYDKLGSKPVINVGVLFSISGLITLAYSPTLALILTSVIMFAVGIALITASIPPLISRVVDKKYYGTALGAMETIKDVGQASGPIIMGLILTYFPFNTAFTVLALIIVLVFAINMYKLKQY